MPGRCGSQAGSPAVNHACESNISNDTAPFKCRILAPIDPKLVKVRKFGLGKRAYLLQLQDMFLEVFWHRLFPHPPRDLYSATCPGT